VSPGRGERSRVCESCYVLAATGFWSRKREMGLGLAGMREAGDDVCGVGLLCQ
jgi:hypothetical protein